LVKVPLVGVPKIGPVIVGLLRVAEDNVAPEIVGDVARTTFPVPVGVPRSSAVRADDALPEAMNVFSM
jgi:hypothetical protein